MKKGVTPKKVVHYAILFILAWISFRVYSSFQSEQDKSRPQGPRDLRRGKHHRINQDDEDFQDDDAPIDLDKRLKEIEKELQRQKRLKTQENQHHDDERLRGYQNENDDESDKRKFENNQRETESRLKQERDSRDKEERRESNSLGNAKQGMKKFNYEDETADRVGQGKQRGHNDNGKGSKGQVLRADGEKQVPDVGKDQQSANKKNPDKEEFQVEPKINWELEEELQRRRKKFQQSVAQRAEEYNPEDHKDMHEADDHLAFVTAGSDRTWAALQQFVYSIQYFYPDSEIGIFDLGLSDKNKQKLETYCGVAVLLPFVQLWPKHLKDASDTLWRPVIWQMSLANFGHIVYVEPERFLYANNMKHYIEHSRRRGITVVGQKLEYSPFVVTHPEMYYFFNVDTRKLQKVNMFDISMLIMHNSEPVRHEFMRYLMSCVMEEYCISPPGSKRKCNHRFYGGSKKYADCHRYEMSAVNILLNKWFQYRQDDYLVRDIATKHYDGTDVSDKIKICPKPGESVKEDF
ncbi:hypothetical protein ACOMHN_018946 [Nucella lapillus]